MKYAEYNSVYLQQKLQHAAKNLYNDSLRLKAVQDENEIRCIINLGR
jgi:hypothetical protein